MGRHCTTNQAPLKQQVKVHFNNDGLPTRYPEAIALPSIETERVAEALVEMFSGVGILDGMLTDCASQFTSEIMKEVARLLSLQQLTTSAFHAQCYG